MPVGTNQTECCLPLTNFSVPSQFQTHATQIRPFLDSNRNGCGISTVNWQIAYHYAFDTPTGFFCQMVSTPVHPQSHMIKSHDTMTQCVTQRKMSLTLTKANLIFSDTHFLGKLVSLKQVTTSMQTVRSVLNLGITVSLLHRVECVIAETCRYV